ncbi:hypothetical protein HL658_22340 [Azospirillum sp. RWY-5-1]|uniref:Uncharacterized protein n=1 Tax=Azospirillum oleiclasticum TaxID=2735135 RepID=A0ABX2TDD6_9PROT|nr:hypothetical protein [Azospirillum oleiclasticum]NYZ15288.1 hypothetical protein [Azospirillum oleiclasticum]NYZ21291.1 hypothetical protein [Azospirillum oleiclasticum]
MDAIVDLLKLLNSLVRLMRDLDGGVFLWLVGIVALVVFVVLVITVVERMRARRNGGGAA